MVVVLLAEPTRPTPVMLTFLAAAIVALVVSTQRPIPRLAIAVLLVGGIAIRWAIRMRVGSDVLDVTVAAIERAVNGINPYASDYPESRPPGAPFPYGPLAIAWYIPVAGMPRLAELLGATIIATVLALRGRFLGLAIYAASPTLVNTSVDGSNDTSLGLLLFVTFILAPRRPRVAAVVLAAAVAFKLSAAAWVPAFMLWGGWRVAAVFGVSSMVAWSPVLLIWGPASFVRSVARANELTSDMVWTLGAALRDILGPDLVKPLEQLRLVFGAVAAAATLRLARSLDGVILAGTAVYIVTLFSGTWATFAYFAAIAPVLCLRIDDWLGLPTFPLVPTNPETGKMPEDGSDATADPAADPTAAAGREPGPTPASRGAVGTTEAAIIPGR